MSKPSLEDYIEVPERIQRFYEKYPEGSLQGNWSVEEIGGQTLIVYTAYAYRSPEDPRPGKGTASEPYPGKTPYTKGSELMNAETSAWGRAIVSLGFLAKDEKVASAEEVKLAKERSSSPTELADNVADLPGTVELVGPGVVEQIKAVQKEAGKSNAALKSFIATFGKESLEDLTLEEGRLTYAWLNKSLPKQKAA